MRNYLIHLTDEINVNEFDVQTSCCTTIKVFRKRVWPLKKYPVQKLDQDLRRGRAYERVEHGEVGEGPEERRAALHAVQAQRQDCAEGHEQAPFGDAAAFRMEGIDRRMSSCV